MTLDWGDWLPTLPAPQVAKNHTRNSAVNLPKETTALRRPGNAQKLIAIIDNDVPLTEAVNRWLWQPVECVSAAILPC